MQYTVKKPSFHLMIIACDNIDEVVHIIRASKTPSDAQRNLEKRFELDELHENKYNGERGGS